MVLMAVRNCFRKNFMAFYCFAFIFILFVDQWLSVPKQLAFRKYKRTYTFFWCYLMSVMNLNIFVLGKYRWIFELCHYFILFLSTSGVVPIKWEGNRNSVSCKLMWVTVLFSKDSFLILVIRVFSFSFIFVHICIFYEFILFPCRIIILLTRQIKGRHCRENAQSCKKSYIWTC